MQRISNAKRCFLTRNLDLEDAVALQDKLPEIGDVFLARVDRIRQHTRLENPEGRRLHLYQNDEIIVVIGHRYATDQFHAQAPAAMGACHLVSASGIASQVVSKNTKVKPATEITLLGALSNETGKVLNLADYSPLPDLSTAARDIATLVVIGSDMNAGKTTTMSACVHGMTSLQHEVFASKLTGTGAGPDYWRFLDAGAGTVMDFVDGGFPSTVGVSPSELISLLQRIKQQAVQSGAEILVVELADGILQPETKALINSPAFRDEVQGVLVASQNAVAAVMITENLVSLGYPVYGISGLMTQAQTACSEVEQATGLPAFGPDDLSGSKVAGYIVASLMRDRTRDAALVSCQ